MLKKFFAILIAFGLVGSFNYVQSQDKNTQTGVILKTGTDTVSYALGTQFGQDLKANEVDIDVNSFTQGIKDALFGEKSLLTDEEISSRSLLTFEEISFTSLVTLEVMSLKSFLIPEVASLKSLLTSEV